MPALALAAIIITLGGCAGDDNRETRPSETDDTPDAAAGRHYDLAELEQERAAKDEYFRREGSPIPDDRREHFAGLRYYPPDTSLVFDLTLRKFPEPEPVQLVATKGDRRNMLRYGAFSFTAGGVPCTLTAYTSEEHPESLFIPFRDATNGTETYEVGRYIDLEIQPDNLYRLDFNRAYNPYCAYNVRYTCPLVPEENILEAAIRAGEMMPEGLEH